MSSIRNKAGDTGWVQSYSCDFCPAKVERKGTGRTLRVALSITDPRSRAPWGAGSLAEIEYEEQRFEDGALDGWGSMSRGRGLSDSEKMQCFDMCPTCFQVMLDQALERAKQEPTSTEVSVGKEVPALRSRRLTTNLNRLADLHAVSDMHVHSAPVVSHGPEPEHLTNPRGRGQVGPCAFGALSRNPSDGCEDQSMPGQWYCFRHAAGGR